MFQTIIDLYEVFGEVYPNNGSASSVSEEAFSTDPYFYLGRSGITLSNGHNINNRPKNNTGGI